MVAVPTHFFKVVLAERGPAPGSEGGEQDAVLGAFVIPNAPVQPDTPLTAFSVPVEALEEAAGERADTLSGLGRAKGSMLRERSGHGLACCFDNVAKRLAWG